MPAFTAYFFIFITGYSLPLQFPLSVHLSFRVIYMFLNCRFLSSPSRGGDPQLDRLVMVAGRMVIFFFFMYILPSRHGP